MNTYIHCDGILGACPIWFYLGSSTRLGKMLLNKVCPRSPKTLERSIGFSGWDHIWRSQLEHISALHRKSPTPPDRCLGLGKMSNYRPLHAVDPTPVLPARLGLDRPDKLQPWCTAGSTNPGIGESVTHRRCQGEAQVLAPVQCPGCCEHGSPIAPWTRRTALRS